jgi:alpha-1,3-rhamnosyl/mannosyltransferase
LRIAIVSQFSSPGGGARFLRGLCVGLLDQAEIAEIGLFIDSAAASRDDVLSWGRSSNRLTLHLMDDRGDLVACSAWSPRDVVRRSRAWALRRPAIVRTYRGLRHRALPGAEVDALRRITLSDRAVDVISSYDVAYFPWPRQIVLPPAPRALVATFHDFNHRHRFGNFRPRDIEVLDAEMVEWLTGRVQPVTSTRFIADELDAYFPERMHEPEVVYLSAFAMRDPDPEEVAAVVAQFGLPGRYVLCPTNIAPHKNAISLLRAQGRMKRGGMEVRLVLTGSGTDCLDLDSSEGPECAAVIRQSIDELRAAIAEEDLVVGEDVWPLGYVTDAQMDALVRGAALVAAPSLYEAGSGPALDAWWLGTPVVSSALPSVVEQMEFLGTEAVLFDPTDVGAMVAALAVALTDRQRTMAMAARSRKAIARYTWDDVGSGYVRVFREALVQSETSPRGTAGAPGGAAAHRDASTARCSANERTGGSAVHSHASSLPG